MEIDELMKMLAEGEGMVAKEAPVAPKPMATPPPFKGPAKQFKVSEVPAEAYKDFKIESAPEVNNKLTKVAGLASLESLWPILGAAGTYELMKRGYESNPEMTANARFATPGGALARSVEEQDRLDKMISTIGNMSYQQSPEDVEFEAVRAKANMRKAEKVLDKAKLNKIKIPSAHEPYAEFMPKGKISEVGAKELVPTSIEELKAMVKKLEGKK